MKLDQYINKYARFIGKDLLAGVDPTGVSTMKYGKQDADSGKKFSKTKMAVAGAGGVIGGLTVVPALVGSVMNMKKGNIVKSGIRGLTLPFRRIKHGKILSKDLGKTLNERYVDFGSLERRLNKNMSNAGFNGEVNLGYLKKLAPQKVPSKLREPIQKAKDYVDDSVSQYQKSLAISGAVSGLSAAAQYRKSYNMSKN